MAKRFELVITVDAALDIEKIRDFNEARQDGLGIKYLEDILDCLERIEQNPRDFPYYRTAQDSIRRGLTKRFSVVVLYDLDLVKNRIEILTVADSRQIGLNKRIPALCI
jgi:plasmid stabilization system protein ParE